MQDKLNNLKEDFLKEIENIQNNISLEELEKAFL